MVPWTERITGATICLASTIPPRLFNFYSSSMLAQDDVARANASTLAPEGGYREMFYSQYLAAERAFYLADPLREVTEAQYDYALNVLPPLAWENGDGVKRFLMSEFQTSSYTHQYAVWQRRYFCRLVDAHDKSTWITAAQCAALTKESPNAQSCP